MRKTYQFSSRMTHLFHPEEFFLAFTVKWCALLLGLESVFSSGSTFPLLGVSPVVSNAKLVFSALAGGFLGLGSFFYMELLLSFKAVLVVMH